MDGDDDELFRKLRRLVAAARSVPRSNRRAILSLESDLRTLRTALTTRSNLLSQRLATAGAGNKAVTAYARTASLADGRPSYK